MRHLKQRYRDDPLAFRRHKRDVFVVIETSQLTNTLVNLFQHPPLLTLILLRLAFLESVLWIDISRHCCSRLTLLSSRCGLLRGCRPKRRFQKGV
jgi:hypothetical protein